MWSAVTFYSACYAAFIQLFSVKDLYVFGIYILIYSNDVRCLDHVHEHFKFLRYFLFEFFIEVYMNFLLRFMYWCMYAFSVGKL